MRTSRPPNFLFMEAGWRWVGEIILGNTLTLSIQVRVFALQPLWPRSEPRPGPLGPKKYALVARVPRARPEYFAPATYNGSHAAGSKAYCQLELLGNLFVLRDKFIPELLLD